MLGDWMGICNVDDARLEIFSGWFTVGLLM